MNKNKITIYDLMTSIEKTLNNIFPDDIEFNSVDDIDLLAYQEIRKSINKSFLIDDEIQEYQKNYVEPVSKIIMQVTAAGILGEHFKQEMISGSAKKFWLTRGKIKAFKKEYFKEMDVVYKQISANKAAGEEVLKNSQYGMMSVDDGDHGFFGDEETLREVGII